MQIRNVVEAGLKKIGKTPCIIGECGIPMDLNSRGAFESGDYTHHTNFLDAVISSLDVPLLFKIRPTLLVSHCGIIMHSIATSWGICGMARISRCSPHRIQILSDKLQRV